MHIVSNKYQKKLFKKQTKIHFGFDILHCKR
jgi:hypothetical protein